MIEQKNIHNRIIKIDNFDFKEISKKIKKKLSENYYIILKNSILPNNEKEVIEFYNQLNPQIGEIKEIDKNKYYTENNDYWVNIEYNNDLNIQNIPWKSNKNLFLHTDNTLTNNLTYANVTELVCIEPSKYSGETFFISNKKIIEVIQFMDSLNNTNLFNDIIETEIYHKNIKKPICYYNSKTNNYCFNFNINQILNNTLNDEKKLEIAKRFADFLENIINSSLVEEIKLNTGDAILFNDELVMHGRRYVFGNRYYKKCSIYIDSI